MRKGTVTKLGAMLIVICLLMQGTAQIVLAEETGAKLTKIKLDRKTANMNIGKSLTLKATPVYSEGEVPSTKLKWQSTNKAVATVTSKGKVKAVFPGKTTIIVSNKNGKIFATCVIKVRPKKVAFTSLILKKNGKAELKWEKVEGATGYAIYRAKSKNGTYKKVKEFKKRSTVSAQLLAYNGKKPYYYKIRAWRLIDGKRLYGSYSTVRTLGAK